MKAPYLFGRKTVWFPTLLGWISLLLVVVGAGLSWWFGGEAFLSHTDRLPAEVLVVDGWIGIKGVDAAAVEYKQGHYRYVVAAGSLTGDRWNERRWSFARMAGKELLRVGVPADRLIVAPTSGSENERTFKEAVSTWRALQARGIHPPAINVFTLGPHARRSRLVFAKVFGPATKVGVISWIPPGYKDGPWWHSSVRAEDFIKETVAYAFELLLNSGRVSNSPRSSVQPQKTPGTATENP